MLSRPVRRIAGLAAAAVIAAVCWLTSVGVGLCLLAGALLLVLVLGLYGYVVKWLKSRKTGSLHQRLLGSLIARISPGDPEVAAKVEQLRRRFADGVETFRRAGKNLYSLPWYLFLGESGAGKTEAIRHCGVTFPPGLHDKFQGAGGTVNMDWWFTNHGVILDTAGRLVEQAQALRTNEWREFLRLLRQHRPRCPINGAFLAIPADTLLKKTPEEIEKKASGIARQFDTIRRTLDVRFPVYILITKSDMLFGFREFFSHPNGERWDDQMLGWSNPQPWDEPFRPECVEEYLSETQQRLLGHRLRLLQASRDSDPEGGNGPSVEAAYAFPQNFAALLPRVTLYLQQIFGADGEWCKPLFVRGIYFTSSMQEGVALDRDVASFLGIPVEQLPEGRVFRQDKALFLRDLFLKKAFREKGLVTHATDAKRLWTRRKALVLGAAIACQLVLAALTVRSVGDYTGTVGKIGPLFKDAQTTEWPLMVRTKNDHLVWKDPDAINRILERLRDLSDTICDLEKDWPTAARYFQGVTYSDIEKAQRNVYFMAFRPVVKGMEERLTGKLPQGEEDFNKLEKAFRFELQEADQCGVELCQDLLKLGQFLNLCAATNRLAEAHKAIQEGDYRVRSWTDDFETLRQARQGVDQYGDRTPCAEDLKNVAVSLPAAYDRLGISPGSESWPRELAALLDKLRTGFQKDVWANRETLFADCNLANEVMTAEDIVELSELIAERHPLDNRGSVASRMTVEKWHSLWARLTTAQDLKAQIERHARGTADGNTLKPAPDRGFDSDPATLVLWAAAQMAKLSGSPADAVYNDYAKQYVEYWQEAYCLKYFQTQRLMRGDTWPQRHEWLSKEYSPDSVLEDLNSLQAVVNHALQGIGQEEPIGNQARIESLRKVKNSWGELKADPRGARATLLACDDLGDAYCLAPRPAGVLGLYVSTLCHSSLVLLAEEAAGTLAEDLEWLRANCTDLFPINRHGEGSLLPQDVDAALQVIRDLELCFRIFPPGDECRRQLLCTPAGLDLTSQDLARLGGFLANCRNYVFQITPLPGDPQGDDVPDSLSLSMMNLKLHQGRKATDMRIRNLEKAPPGQTSIQIPCGAEHLVKDLFFEVSDPGRPGQKTCATPPVAGPWAPFEMLRGTKPGARGGIALRAVPGSRDLSWFIKLEVENGGSLWLKAEFFPALGPEGRCAAGLRVGADGGCRTPFAFNLWQEARHTTVTKDTGNEVWQ